MTFSHCFLILAGYFALAAIGRCLASASAELDESEQLVLTQALAWGYGPQPPLYTWLQSLAFTVLGIGIPALALLKAILLFGTFTFTWLCVRQVVGPTRPALVAVMGLCFLPQIIWESQRDLTHSVLATTASAATLLVFLRLMSNGRLFNWLLFGLCMGIGLLSKYNYGLFLAALVLAALTLPQGRAVLLNWRVIVSLAVLLLLLLPHVGWALDHRAALLSRSDKLHEAADLTLLKAWAMGFASLGQSVALFLGPLAGIGFLVFGRAPQDLDCAPEATTARLLTGRTMLAGLLLCAMLVFCFRAHFKDRWLQPLFCIAPVYFALVIRPRLTPATLRHVMVLAGAVALAVLLVLSMIPMMASVTKRPTRLNAPYAALAAQLRSRNGEPGVIVADSRLTGGNLRLFFKRATVLVPELVQLTAPKDKPWLIVWDATRSSQPPASLVALTATLVGTDLNVTRPFYIEAPLSHLPEKSMKLACVEWGPKAGP